jgi:dihydrofolate synthase/folylpolyglutamate synthase
MTTYPDSVRYLYSLGNEIRTMKLGLDRIRLFLKALGEPRRAFGSVHIAGTNGKGSVAAMISSALRVSGVRTGLYTSPHLVEPTERIQIDGEPVSEEQFVSAFEQVHSVAEEMYRRGKLDAHPTYFETVTAMGFLLFRDLGVETAVVETGLGGRLDATNVLTPALSVITRVDYDHEHVLGHSIESIAAEKAGILKPGVPAVFGAQRPEALAALRQKAAEVGAPVTEAGEWEVRELELSAGGSRFIAVRGAQKIRIECGLAGEHQAENAVTAVAALDALGLDGETIAAGIRAASWPGRLETIPGSPEILLDGAHNPAGVRALAAHLKRFHGGRRIWLIYAAMRDKSLDEIAGILSPVADHVILTTTEMHRALRPAVLESLFEHSSVQIAAGVDEALDMARRAAAEDLVVITGSLMLVGAARGRLVR